MRALKFKYGYVVEIREAMLAAGRFTTREIHHRLPFACSRSDVCCVARTLWERRELRWVSGKGNNGNPRIYEVAR